ncbi:hypothetical protein D3C81_2139010 [compost metagenome]
MAGTTSQGGGSLGPAATEQGENLLAQVIAGKLLVAVRGVLDPAQLMRSGVRLKLGPWHIQQRPHQTPASQGTMARHCRQAPDPRAP